MITHQPLILFAPCTRVQGTATNSEICFVHWYAGSGCSAMEVRATLNKARKQDGMHGIAVRNRLAVRIAGSHPADRGSIPRYGSNRMQLPPLILQWPF